MFDRDRRLWRRKCEICGEEETWSTVCDHSYGEADKNNYVKCLKCGNMVDHSRVVKHWKMSNMRLEESSPVPRHG